MLVVEYIRRSGATEYIFHNEHKTLYNLFNADPAVSCDCDKLVTHREIYTLCSIFAAFLLGVCRFYFSHGCVHMGQMDFTQHFYLMLFQNYLVMIDH